MLYVHSFMIILVSTRSIGNLLMSEILSVFLFFNSKHASRTQQHAAMSSSAGSTNNNAFEIEDVEENEEEEEYYCLDSNDDEEDEQQVDSEEQQEEKDNEGEIVVDEGQYPKTLLKELLDQYEDLKKASSQLPPRKASRLTSRAIGKLPNI